MSPAKITTLAIILSITPLTAFSQDGAPCERVGNLSGAIDCIRQNEPAFRSALSGEREAEALENSAYRLINPDLQLEYIEGKSSGDVQRESNASLLFTLELGGKRGARARVLSAEGLNLQADAFEQQITALTELGGGLLRLHQLERERAVIQESADTFRGVIRLFKSRGNLPPEQRVSLNAFELIILDYGGRLLEVEAELLRFQMRTAKLFGTATKGQPLDVSKFLPDIKSASKNLEDWIARTPEMLRLTAERTKAEGEFALAKADVWPDLKIGPAIRQTYSGPYSYQSLGFSVSMPIPVLSWNGALRESRELTQNRVTSKAKWENQDIRSQYVSKLAQLEKISKLLKETPSEEEIHRKHTSSESLFNRGLVGGALIIEAHRSIVDYYQTKHALERKFLEDSLKIQTLSKVGSPQ